MIEGTLIYTVFEIGKCHMHYKTQKAVGRRKIGQIISDFLYVLPIGVYYNIKQTRSTSGKANISRKQEKLELYLGTTFVPNRLSLVNIFRVITP